jgi:hypothetical protein
MVDSLDAQIQPTNDTSEPADIETIDDVMSAYDYSPANEPELTSPSEVLPERYSEKGSETSPKALENLSHEGV